MRARRDWFAWLRGAVGAMAVIGGAACTAQAPSQPAFDTDVLPIFAAHCNRCHGAGGTLNVALEPSGPDAAVLASISTIVPAFRNFRCYLNVYPIMTGDCGSDGGAVGTTCKAGALHWAKLGALSSSIKPGAMGATRMPPDPAPRLTDWEREVVDNWELHPICSNSPNPDPSICPPGSGP